MPDIFTAPKTEDKTAKNELDHHALSSAAITPGIFSALIHHPHGIAFAHQEKNEQIILFTRSHFITNLPWLFITFIAIFIPPLFIPFWRSLNIPFSSPSLSVTIILLLFYYLILIGFAFYNFCNWFYNIGIVTQKRILDIDFMHLSYIDIAITQLPEVEDVVHRQKGFFASFFDYGDVIAHTVPGKENFVFENIPHPTQVVDIMSKLIGD